MPAAAASSCATAVAGAAAGRPGAAACAEGNWGLTGDAAAATAAAALPARPPAAAAACLPEPGQLEWRLIKASTSGLSENCSCRYSNTQQPTAAKHALQYFLIASMGCSSRVIAAVLARRVPYVLNFRPCPHILQMALLPAQAI